jgi:Spy/CpxP family protein refolding chaperone
MRNTLLALLAMAALFLVLPGSSAAQQQQQSAPAAQSGQTISDQDIQMLRSDLRGQKKEIIAQNMNLTPEQAEKFWPVYDAYTQETIKLNDARYALIKDYAQSYDSMTDAQAESLMNRQIDLDQSFVRLRQTWRPKFEKVISPKQTARFFQLDRRVALLIDLQLASQIPLVKQ